MKTIFLTQSIKYTPKQSGKGINLTAGQAYIVPDQFAYHWQKGFELQGYFGIVKQDEVFLPKFDIKDSIKHCVIIRAGGIGDLVALSSIAKFLFDNGITVEVHCVDRYKYLEDWFAVPVKFSGFFEPVCPHTESEYMFPTKSVASSEGLIDMNRRNWYEIFFEMIGVDKPPLEYCRPFLKYKMQSNFLGGLFKNVLFCLRGSSAMRTARFKDIYETVLKMIKESGQKVNCFVHKEALLPDDIKYIGAIEEKPFIIGSRTPDEFISDVASATLVISVDTSIIHIREGLNRPAVGIYGSFSTESRTKHYKYTMSIDVESGCPDQPCFKQDKTGHDRCWLGAQSLYAPCLDGSSYNKTLSQQIYSWCKEYILNALR